MFNGKDVKAYAAAGLSYKHLAVTAEQLKKCEAPFIFIHGANESETVKKQVRMVRKALGRGEVKMIDGGDHITTLTKPEFGTTILEFLKSVKPS
jgi:pimeloyl-ACP methyl ester carboxylesterase